MSERIQDQLDQIMIRLEGELNPGDRAMDAAQEKLKAWLIDNKREQLKDIVIKLIGPFTAVGCSARDDASLKNLKILITLVDDLLCEIIEEVPNKDRHEYSIQQSGREAHGYLLGLKETLEEIR